MYWHIFHSSFARLCQHYCQCVCVCIYQLERRECVFVLFEFVFVWYAKSRAISTTAASSSCSGGHIAQHNTLSLTLPYLTNNVLLRFCTVPFRLHTNSPSSYYYIFCAVATCGYVFMHDDQRWYRICEVDRVLIVILLLFAALAVIELRVRPVAWLLR